MLAAAFVLLATLTPAGATIIAAVLAMASAIVVAVIQSRQARHDEHDPIIEYLLDRIAALEAENRRLRRRSREAP